ncbi:glycosyltransferase [Methanospirillum hungatei]|uniref:glycosyltransferase n=1 Tax=Methanospirillum hungatei TaxID=2203 RepID=UPI0026EC0C7E|nr:glycosyltransferase [Methanospirillum hungatei]MCA1916160.1 glycosyltransferase [Methanospirillum hungatei]
MKKNTHPVISVIGPSTRFLSGISYYTIRLCNALSEKSAVNAVLFRNMLPKRLFPGWKRVGVTTSSVSFSDTVDVAEVLDWYNPFSWATGAQRIRRSDVIILEWWTSSVVHMFLALLLLSGRKARILIEFHEVVDPLEYAILPLRMYAKAMGRIIRRKADRFIVHSEHDRKLIASQYRIDPSRIVVIPHGLYDQYPIMKKEESTLQLGVQGKCVLLFFGLLRPYKGVSHLIQAFEKLPSYLLEKTVLIIAGEAWEDQESLDRVKESPVSDRIILENRYISDEDIPVFFSAADLLVLPYTRASQSGVAHIGIAYGLPILATEVGGLVESLGSYAGTRFVRPGDNDGLAEAMTDLILHKKQDRYDPPEEMRWNRIAERFMNEIINPVWEKI